VVWLPQPAWRVPVHDRALALERVDLEAAQQRRLVDRQLVGVGVGVGAQQVGRERGLVGAEGLRDLARRDVGELREVRVGELGDHVPVDQLVEFGLGEDLRLRCALARLGGHVARRSAARALGDG
jgi:hypothetical protein